MSKAEREAFVAGATWHNIPTTTVLEAPAEALRRFPDKVEDIRIESLSRFPDKPCKNVREIVVEWLKENGYEGLCNPLIQCECFLDDRPGCELMACCEIIAECLPGVLRHSKIVPKEV